MKRPPPTPGDFYGFTDGAKRLLQEVFTLTEVGEPLLASAHDGFGSHRGDRTCKTGTLDLMARHARKWGLRETA
jgi:hypothetical protein